MAVSSLLENSEADKAAVKASSQCQSECGGACGENGEGQKREVTIFDAIKAG